MDCPICAANAEQIQIPTTIDDVSIVCPTCGEYDVASAVVATGQLQKLGPEQRRDALDQAKRSAEPSAPRDHRLLAVGRVAGAAWRVGRPYSGARPRRKSVASLVRLAAQQARLPASEPGHAHQVLPLR
jgi:hypothetical protein